MIELIICSFPDAFIHMLHMQASKGNSEYYSDSRCYITELCCSRCGKGDSSVIECRTCDQKGAHSNPGSHGQLSVQTLFQYPFHPWVTAVAHRKCWSFCQSADCRLQLNTYAPCVCGFE